MAVSTRMSLAILVFAAACGGEDTTGPSPAAECTDPTVVDLSVGGLQVVDPALSGGCIALASHDSPSEYLVIAYSGAGQVTGTGVSGGYQLTTSPGAVAPAPARRASGADLLAVPVLGLEPQPMNAVEFHSHLRQREAQLARSGAASLSPRVAALRRGPPVVGAVEEFNACLSLSCEQVTRVTATARVVGEQGVVWVDNATTPGADALTSADLQQLSALFDDYVFAIDTTAFGLPSDIDGNQRVDILITEQVNKLTTDCSAGRVVGYFFGGDLLATYPGTNQREVFFAFAPRPASGNCPAVTRTTALRSLPPVLIHEMQHMISFNQRVLRRGRADEVAWLNEGLSHFAEDLGQLLIPDARCPASASCFAEFASGNLHNAYSFMSNPEATYLVAGEDDGPTLEGRGAAWLFVRWLADHFSSDTLRGTELTRALINGSATGALNVATATGVPFATLVGEWLSSLWVDGLTGVPTSGRLGYETWNFRTTFAANSPGTFPKAFPLEPTVASHGVLSASGTLRGGTGRFTLVGIPTGGAPVEVHLVGGGGSAPTAALTARLAVVRTR